MKKKLLVLLSLISFDSYCQIYEATKFANNNGLSNNTVFKLVQDNKGYIWACTSYGLNRFDGTNFVRYTASNGLTNNSIMSIFFDSKNTGIITTYTSGLNKITNGKISKLLLTDSIGLPNKITDALFFNNKIWLISPDYITLYSFDNKIVKPYAFFNKRRFRITKGIVAEGKLYLASNIGLLCIDSNEKIEQVLSYKIKNKVNALAYSTDSTLWVSTEKQLYQIKFDKIITTIQFRTNTIVSDMTTDKSNKLWLASVNLGISYLSKQGKIITITENLGLSHIGIINDLLVDNENNIWLATNGTGIYQFDPSLTNRSYVPHLNNTGGLYCSAISQVSDNSIMIGAIGKILRFKNNAISFLNFNTLSKTDYIYFIQPKGSTIYIGVHDGVITKEINSHLPDTKIRALKGSDIGGLAILIDYNGIDAWLGSYDGIYKISLKNKYISEKDRVINNVRCNSIARDSKGTLFFGTDSGVLIRENGTFKHLNINTQVLGNNVNVVFIDNNNQVWIGTEFGVGLLKTDGTYSYLIKNCRCYSIISGYNNNIWIGTSSGIFRYLNKENNLYRIYNTSNIRSDVLKIAAFDDKYLYLGLADGFSIISQHSYPYNPPNTYINSIETDDTHLITTDTVNIKNNNNKLLITFSAVHFSLPSQLMYKYKIKGLHNAWVYTSNNTVDIPSLPGGDYLFIVAAKVGNSNWGPVKTIYIKKALSIWEKKWFIITITGLVIIFISCLIYVTIHKKEKRKRDVLTNSHKLIHLRLQALIAQMNPHFIFNCMNSIQYLISRNELQLASTYLVKLARLLRLNLNDSEYYYIPLNIELKRLNLYLEIEQMRVNQKFNYLINVDTNVDQSNTLIPNMILQPFIENSIWHGFINKTSSGEIILKIIKSNNYIHITILDNGSGIDDNFSLPRNEKSIGLKLVEERLSILSVLTKKKHSYNIFNIVDGNTIKGVQVDIYIPY